MLVIERDGTRFAIILRKLDQDLDNTLFITDPKWPLQVGVLTHRKGYVEKPHYHKIQERSIKGIPQMLFLKKGKINIEFFDRNNVKFNSVDLSEGDLILLLDGSHRLIVEESMNAVMAKLGPYSGELEDKVEIIEKQ